MPSAIAVLSTIKGTTERNRSGPVAVLKLDIEVGRGISIHIEDIRTSP